MTAKNNPVDSPPVNSSGYFTVILSFLMKRNNLAKKYRRLFCRLALGFVILFLVSILTGITVFDYQHNNIVFEYLAAEDDFAILSATFYRTSKRSVWNSPRPESKSLVLPRFCG